MYPVSAVFTAVSTTDQYGDHSQQSEVHKRCDDCEQSKADVLLDLDPEVLVSEPGRRGYYHVTNLASRGGQSVDITAIPVVCFH